jgi:arylformamidase
MFCIRPKAPSLLVIWGADETREFWRQSKTFQMLYVEAGNEATLYAVEGRDHYSLLSAWREFDSPQLKRILDHMNSCW